MSSPRIDILKARVRELPNHSGVYLMKAHSEKVIYVGKAKDLRARVRSYFQEQKNVSPKTQYLVAQIEHIDYIITKTEVEAFLLEASLIKKHKPRYNIRLKDDKAYPYIRVSMPDDYPRFYLFRKVKADGALYFGPYTSGLFVRETIRFLNRTFRIRDCTDGFMRARTRPCLTYQIGRCSGPCVKLIDRKTYGMDVENALDFLRGRNKKLISELSKKMKEAAVGERFEAAAKLRDSTEAIRAILEKQIVVSDKEDLDQDVIAFFGDERGALIETLHIRAGRIIGNRSQFVPRLVLCWRDVFRSNFDSDFADPLEARSITALILSLAVQRFNDSFRGRFVHTRYRGYFIKTRKRNRLDRTKMLEKRRLSDFTETANFIKLALKKRIVAQFSMISNGESVGLIAQSY